MNDSLNKELKKMKPNIKPLAETEMSLILGGVNSTGTIEDAQWCIVKGNTVCGNKILLANRDITSTEQRISFSTEN